MPGCTPYKSMHDVSQIGISGTKLSGDQRYNALRNLDDHSDTSTEVGDWDAEDGEKSWRAKKTSLCGRLKGYSWLANTILLLAVIGLLVDKKWGHNYGHQYEFAGDITGFAPRCTNV